MATQWYWLENEQEKGPVSFQNLVLMVRKHVLNEDDLVRPHYTREWEKACRVVGLFHMARRISRERPATYGCDEAHSGPAVDEEPSLQQSETADGDELQTWFREQLATTPIHGSVGTVEDSEFASDVREVASNILPARGDLYSWQSAIDAAVSQLDGRHCQQKMPRKNLSEVVSAATLRTVLRLGLSLVAMNAAVVAILSWSAAEAQRHPDRQALARQIRPFPGWGPSSPAEFTFLLVDAALIAAVAGYGGARALEAMTDD